MRFFLCSKLVCNCFVIFKYHAVLMVVFFCPPELSLKLRYPSDLSIEVRLVVAGCGLVNMDSLGNYRGDVEFCLDVDDGMNPVVIFNFLHCSLPLTQISHHLGVRFILVV